MMEIIDYLKARYLSEKGQGMAEYALVLAFVVAIIVAVGTTVLVTLLRVHLTRFLVRSQNNSESRRGYCYVELEKGAGHGRICGDNPSIYYAYYGDYVLRDDIC